MVDKHATTKKGYLRYRKDDKKRLRMEHCLVWEEHFGEIPEGMQIHHIDGNKQNNNISNLQLVTPTEHKRIHEGCLLKDGIWYKKCSQCGEYKAITKDNWYYSRGYVTGKICKPCYVRKVVEERRQRVEKGWKRKEYR